MRHNAVAPPPAPPMGSSGFNVPRLTLPPVKNTSTPGRGQPTPQPTPAGGVNGAENVCVLTSNLVGLPSQPNQTLPSASACTSPIPCAPPGLFFGGSAHSRKVPV